jgi:O-antigen ligase
MWDVDNAYVASGLRGGLVGLLLFIAIFVTAYRMVGTARRQAESARMFCHARMVWALGAAFFANTIAYFGIVFFDQSIILWNMLLVMVSVGTACSRYSITNNIPRRCAEPPLLPENRGRVVAQSIGASRQEGHRVGG